MTIVILTIDDDGRSRAYHTPTLRLSDLPYLDLLTPVRSGDDRGHYDVFEVAGVSIDVMTIDKPPSRRELCAPHECKRIVNDRYPCRNVKHDKSRDLCATCFNHGCRKTDTLAWPYGDGPESAT